MSEHARNHQHHHEHHEASKRGRNEIETSQEETLLEELFDPSQKTKVSNNIGDGSSAVDPHTHIDSLNQNDIPVPSNPVQRHSITHHKPSSSRTTSSNSNSVHLNRSLDELSDTVHEGTLVGTLGIRSTEPMEVEPPVEAVITQRKLKYFMKRNRVIVITDMSCEAICELLEINSNMRHGVLRMEDTSCVIIYLKTFDMAKSVISKSLELDVKCFHVSNTKL